MDYNDFSVEELASDERFISWVKDDCSETEKDFWRILALSNPHLGEKIDRAKILVMNVDRAESGLDRIDPEKVNEIWQNVLAGIDEEESQSTHEAATRVLPSASPKTLHAGLHRRFRWFAAAASVVLSISAFYFFKKDIHQPTSWYSYRQNVPGFIEVVNNTQSPMQLHLQDGSVISLEVNSRVKYKESYAADTIRKIYLAGEAFFNVARDPHKAFVVFTNDVATEVLGTSFRVKGDPSSNNVVVKVKTGKVSVYSVKKQSARLQNPKNGVILLPNQEVTYTHEGLFEKKIVERPELVEEAADDTFVFENTPIDNVFQKLQDAYGVEILFDRETMKNCFLTVHLGAEPLFEKLKVICRTIGATYETIDARIVITSPGCKTSNIENLNE